MSDSLESPDLGQLVIRLRRNVEEIIGTVRELEIAGRQGEQDLRTAVFDLAGMLRVHPELLRELPLRAVPGELGLTHKILSEGTTRSYPGAGEVPVFVTLTDDSRSGYVKEVAMDSDPGTVRGWLNSGEEDRGTFRDPREVLRTLSRAFEEWAQEYLNGAQTSERSTRIVELARELAQLVT
jgi:hypothetical protein